jgi:diaminohydroxyphosphoribosylaminopyrimidine deaminase/5-amino-6-(5-phosphoribosylamino)uracil reductase
MHSDSYFISQCLELAAKGQGQVSPNPLVGCVIVRDGKIIGKGYHKKFGGPHAEIEAFTSARGPVSGATLYVNLEPCSHHGKTPPCADAIIAKGIKRVVIGSKDPNPLVSGKGIAKLRAAGIDVAYGILEDACVELNLFFFKYIQTKLPYVTMKAGQTLDGAIAARSGDSQWITSQESRTTVHAMRSFYDAVLVGTGTARADNPELTVRLVTGRNPKRIVLDRNLSLPFTLKLFKENHEKNVYLLTTSKAKKARPVKVQKLIECGVHIVTVKTNSDGKLSPKAILTELGKLGIASVLLEGGSSLYTSFLRASLIDEICLFIAPKILGTGLPVFGDLGNKKIADASKWRICESRASGPDLALVLRPAVR